jgi:Fe2+ or Zn2+ uptake regulation protein
LLRPPTDQLDRIYFCKTCNKVFLFKSDIEEHMQSMPRHQEFAIMPFE